MRKFILLLLLPFILANAVLLLQTGCHKPPYECYNYTNATITAWSNADSLPRAADESGIKATTFYLEVDIIDSVLSCFVPGANPFINAAYAMPGYENAQYVDTILITSNKEFDAAHPAGTALNDLFYRRKQNSKEGIYYLVNKPADTGTHTFTAKVFIKNPDKIFIAVTPPVKLLP